MGILRCVQVCGTALLLTGGVAQPAFAATQSSSASAFAVTPPLRDLAARPGDELPARVGKDGEVFTGRRESTNPQNRKVIKQIVPGAGAGAVERFVDEALPGRAAERAEVMPAVTTFAGISNTTTATPPDTNGDVGRNHYILTANTFGGTAATGVGIYNKGTGALAVPVFQMSTLFASLPVGSLCRLGGDGDPIVVYDSFADRWLLSEFVIFTAGGSVLNPTRQCIAISQTGDPTGAWYAYEFNMPAGKVNDYPHFGVWSDAYYMTDNEFNTALTTFLGAGIFAFDRAKMLAGDATASYVYFDVAALTGDATAGGQLPTDADGLVPPPAGLNQMVMEFRADEFGDPADALRMYRVVPNFTTPASSTLTVLPDVPLAAFDARSPATRAVNEVLGGVAVDAIADRLMFRLQYRNLGSFAVPANRWAGNFTVNVGGLNPTSAATYQAGIRWFVLGSAGTAAPTVSDQGTHSVAPGTPAGGMNLWMGSAALDNQGNLAVGYSRSSAADEADIYVAGRLASDAAGSLAQGEGIFHAAGGAQSSTGSRWGDYSDMTVDPVDDCTFWFSQEFYPATGATTWSTRFGRFVYPSCVAAQQGLVEVNVTNCATSAPIAGASVAMSGGFFNTTDGTGGLITDFSAAPGAYTVTSSRTGYLSGPSSTAPAVVINGSNTVVNVCLTPTAIAQAATSSMVSEACTPANSALDPGEFVNLSFCISNTGTADTVAAVGTLQNAGGVTGAGPAQNYGVLLAGGPPVCRTFSFFVDAALTCGGNVTPTVQLQDGATNLGNLVYATTRTGALGAPVTSPAFSSVGVLAITDNAAAGVNVNLPVAGVVGEITDLNFRFDVGGGVCDQTVGDVDAGLDHTWVGDVRVRLTAPAAGPNATLVDQIGVPASQFGLNAENFCAVVLDDEGGFPPIENTVADPVAGNFSPVNPLSAFDGLSGAAVNGTWVLNAADLAAGDTGSLRRFSLVITAAPRTCQTGGTCSTTPVELLDFGVEGAGRKR